ncbi:hypothetical protein SLS62_009069 [Diatrype stigma]|uniref:Rhodopsin domain-containing protein n=1 Tax=Diatrype stigma TaxID=117547 RepID=A0AAN9UGM1_9PEZI
MKHISFLVLWLSALQLALAAGAETPPACGITECVTAGCSIREQLATKKFSEDTCGVEGEDRRSLVRTVTVIFGSLGLAAFILRCLSRFIMGLHTWGYDDSVMCLAVLYFFDEIVYIAALGLTKISILFFYLKVFPKRSFRICAWVLIGLNLAYFLAYDFLLIFQCQPIPGAWRVWDGEFEAKCISINVLGWSAAVINIVLDLAVIILPLPELFRLSMSMKKRVQIVAMFAVGFFTTVVSVVRLSSLIRFGTTSNVTQDYVEVGYWSTVEVPVGIICACMPAARSLFSVALPKIFGSTKDPASKYGSYGGPSSVSKLANQSNKISVKQEWTVLRDSSDETRPHVRSDSDVELVLVSADDGKGSGSGNRNGGGNGKANGRGANCNNCKGDNNTTHIEAQKRNTAWPLPDSI